MLLATFRFINPRRSLKRSHQKFYFGSAIRPVVLSDLSYRSAQFPNSNLNSYLPIMLKNIMQHWRNHVCQKLEASLRVFAVSSGWPSVFCSWRLPWEVRSISSFIFSPACDPPVPPKLGPRRTRSRPHHKGYLDSHKYNGTNRKRNNA